MSALNGIFIQILFYLHWKIADSLQCYVCDSEHNADCENSTSYLTAEVFSIVNL